MFCAQENAQMGYNTIWLYIIHFELNTATVNHIIAGQIRRGGTLCCYYRAEGMLMLPSLG